jgi:purine nucleoside phosphorylase
LFICGRKHFYEGNAGDIVRLIEFVHELGVRRLVVTSAAGSLVKSIQPGELVLVDDVLDFQFQPPSGAAIGTHVRLKGHPAGRPGEKGRLSLDPVMRRQLGSAATRASVAFGRGSVVTCAGPVYETASEIRAFQRTGSSLVTMSGAPEVKVANALGIRVAMIALVTNWAAGISTVKLRHDDVLAAAENAIPKLTRLITQFIENK